MQVPFEQVYYAFAEKPDKLFDQDWSIRLLHLGEYDWNNWRVERFCVFIVQRLYMFQSVRDIKNSLFKQ